MSRIRYLKPEFFLDEDVAELSFAARLLFQGLWVLADREGRLEDRPAWIRVQAFPYDKAVVVDELLEELTRTRSHSPGAFIVRYTVGSNKYIQITNFSSHQKPHPKEAASKIPPCNSTASRGKVRRGREKDMSSRMGKGMGKGREGGLEREGNGKAEADSAPPPPEVDPHVAVLRLEIEPVLAKLATDTGRPPAEILAEASLTGQGAAFAALEECESVSWLQATRGRLVAMCLQVKARAPAPPTDPKEIEAAMDAWDNLPALVDEFLAWYTENPEAGEAGGRRGIHGQAFGSWPRAKDIPPGPRDAVLKGALKRLSGRDESLRIARARLGVGGGRE